LKSLDFWLFTAYNVYLSTLVSRLDSRYAVVPVNRLFPLLFLVVPENYESFCFSIYQSRIELVGI
jgi:hypothetical protein